MAQDITMPQLGESVTEGTIAKWLKNPGDWIEKYEPICEVETDKVTTEVPSLHAGVVGDLLVNEGETVAVGQVICQLQMEEEATNKKEQRNKAQRRKISLKEWYSPVVRRLAQEHGLDLEQVHGTGRQGRITRQDVWNKIHQTQEEVPVKASVKRRQPLDSGVIESQDQTVPLNHIRRSIADRMVRSKEEIPHAWMMMEVDTTGLVQLRERIKKDFLKREGIKLTFLPFFLKATVDTLKEFPYLNSVWANDRIVLKKRINISLAVGTDEALYVPVIPDADEKSIVGLAKAVHQVVEKTKAGELGLADVEGGTFTVNNTGSFGSIASQPIINHPQAAILAFEAIVKRPVVIDQMIAIRDMMNLSISIDHRILDGVKVGRFLARVKERLESYTPQTMIYG